MDDGRGRGATHSPLSAAAIGSRPAEEGRRPGRQMIVEMTACGRGPQAGPVIAPQEGQTTSMPDLEEQQEDPDVSRQLQLPAGRDVAGSERRTARNRRSDRQVGNRRSRGRGAARRSSGRDRGEEDQPDLRMGVGVASIADGTG